MPTLPSRTSPGPRTPLLRRAAALLLPVCALVPVEAQAAAPTSAPVASSAQVGTATTEGCTVSAKLVNSCRPWLGAESIGYGPTGFRSAMLGHEARVGRQVDIVHEYLGQGDTLTSDIVSLATRPDTIALVNWRLVNRWADADGTNATVNTQIDNMARSIKALGSTKIMLTPFHEPENDISPGGGPVCPEANYHGSSGKIPEYVQMWHTVRERFDALGVNNVVWVMNYMGWEDWNCTINLLWPGNDLVDWVMWDPYPRNAGWAYHVGGFYRFLTANSDAEHDYLSKPWGLAEFGNVGATQLLATTMYDDARRALQAGTYPKLKAYVVWDAKTANSTDVRVGYTRAGVADPNEQQHYNAFANDPLLTGSATPATDQTAPTVTLSAPQDGARVAGTVAVTGRATDDVGVASVDLLVDGESVETGVPRGDGTIGFDWDTTTVLNGSHTVQLRATDAAGNTDATAARSVTVANADSQAPSAPASASATWSRGTVTVEWGAATDDHAVAAYRVLRDGTEVAVVHGDVRSWADQTVADLTTYTYSVTALDGAENEGSPAVAVPVTTGDSTAPSVPAGVSATLTGADTASVSWSPSTDAVGVTGYRVLRNGTLLRSVGADQTSLTDTGLADGRTFAYQVVAVDAAGNTTEPSAASSVTTADRTPPSAPSGLTATATGSSVGLSWTAASDNVGVDQYVVRRDGTVLARVPGTSRSFADTAPVGSTAHRYTVTAVDAAGLEGQASNEAVRPTADTTAPGAATLSGSRSGYVVNLSWTAASDNVGVTGYTVYRDAVAIATTTSRTAADTRPPPGATSRYTVRARDAAGNLGAASNAVAVAVPADSTAPSTPGSPRATAGTTGSRQVTVSWNASTDNAYVASYYLYRGNSKYRLLDGSVTSFVDTGLTAGTRYTYKVYAIDGAGRWSGSSDNVSATAR